MAGTALCFLLFSCLIVFIANLSLIFIEYLGVSKTYYGFYQTTTMVSFALFSFISIKMISYFGVNTTKKIGLLAAGTGSILLLIAAFTSPEPVFICAAMVVFSAGTTFAGPIYSIEAANTLPQLRGVASGMNNAMRHIIIASIVMIGGSFFDGSIRPVALLIAASTLTVFFLAAALHTDKFLKNRTIEE